MEVSFIKLDNIDGNVLKLVIEFIYGHELPLKLNPDICLESLLMIAQDYEIERFQNEVEMFLLANISIDNCLELYKACEKYGREPFKRNVEWFILHNFSEISVDHFLLELNQWQMMNFLADDWLNTKSGEEEVFNVIKRFAETENDTISILWPCLRYGLLSPKFIYQHVAKCQNVDDEIMKKIEETIIQMFPQIDRRFSNGPSFCQKSSVLSIQYLSPRNPSQFLFAFGGWSSGACTGAVEVYDCSVDRWLIAGNVDNGPRAYQETLVHDDGLIYMIGGFDGTDHYNGCRTLDPWTFKWKEIAPMNNRFANFKSQF